MAIPVTCSNSQCGRVLNLKDELAGKKVRCPECGAVIQVPAATSGQAGLPESQQEPAPPKHHPARLVCTNCGAVLGVRDATCPSCGGDVRSGVTIMRITAEQKAKAGLFGAFRRTTTKKTMTRKYKRGGGLAKKVVVLLVIAGLVVGGLWLARERGYFPAKTAQEQTEVEQPAAP